MFIRKGGGSGATTLSALTDTSISSPSDGQILGFNGITGKWENKNPSGGGVAESVVGTVESGTTASQPYAVGEHFIRNDKFCTCISTIASGATLTLNTNYVEGTISENLAYGNYSTSETFTGDYWIDGKKIYRKVIDCGNAPNNSSKRIASGLDRNCFIVNLRGFAYNTGYYQYFAPLPYPTCYGNRGAYNICYNYYDAAQPSTPPGILIQTDEDRSAYKIYMILEYVKNYTWS